MGVQHMRLMELLGKGDVYIQSDIEAPWLGHRRGQDDSPRVLTDEAWAWLRGEQKREGPRYVRSDVAAEIEGMNRWLTKRRFQLAGGVLLALMLLSK